MVIGVSIFLFIAIVFVVAYPLFFQETVSHISSATTSSDFSEQDALLSALTDLEEEFQLGKLSKSDYHRLKLHLQRHYLHVKKTGSSELSPTSPHSVGQHSAGRHSAT